MKPRTEASSRSLSSVSCRRFGFAPYLFKSSEDKIVHLATDLLDMFVQAYAAAGIVHKTECIERSYLIIKHLQTLHNRSFCDKSLAK